MLKNKIEYVIKVSATNSVTAYPLKMLCQGGFPLSRNFYVRNFNVK